MSENPIGLAGIEFVEFAAADPRPLKALFRDFGFAEVMRQGRDGVAYFKQNDIHFLVGTSGTHASAFQLAHGPSIASMGWRVANARTALQSAVARGARPAVGDYKVGGQPVPAVYGIGDSLIYFIEAGLDQPSFYSRAGFEPLATPDDTSTKGFLAIDHLTNNVPKGEMARWRQFYADVFGFIDVRYFDIRGVKTGLTSYAMRSPCGGFCIPINEGTEDRSQINEYLREYRGPGIQHLAFLTDDIVTSLEAMRGSAVSTLDIDDAYYAEVFDRVPNVTEDHETLRRLNVLVDGDEKGYLLQIFTRNVVGPIFIEMIQRKNHASFGEGNFGALFRSIERDQEARGAL